MRHTLIWPVMAVLLTINSLSLLLGDSVQPTSHGMNVLLILADDLGWSDLACYGNDYHQTPHIDQFAAEAVRFTSAYAMPVCTPSRAALLTGKHPARLRMTVWSEGTKQGPTDRLMLQAQSSPHLCHSEVTIAELYHRSGYLTALVGKWHLGDAEHYPETHGFDINIGGNHWGAPQSFFWPYRGRGRFGQEFRYVPHLEFGSAGEYLTDRLTDEAIKIIDQAGDQPWFLYLAHYAPHTPIEAKESDVQYYEQKLRTSSIHQNPVYAAMIGSLDESVGRLLAHLNDRKLADNTIVIFASDNGGYIGKDRAQNIPVTSNWPLRSGKGSLYEGGIRIPMIVRWPGVSSGGRVVEQPVVLMDLFSTLTEQLPSTAGIPSVDGLSLLSTLKQTEEKLARQDLFFHYPHYYHAPPTTPVSAIRSGDWKLLHYLEDDRVELYNLREDPGEQEEVSERFFECSQSLMRRLNDWRREIDASMPMVNTNSATHD
jgi:arylsulfatase A